MTQATNFMSGEICWMELSASDQEAAKRFYGKLLGWSFDDRTHGNGETYAVARLNGKDVCAITGHGPEQLRRGATPSWLSFVSAANTDEIVNKAKSLGGKVLAAPSDVRGSGRTALIADPSGAAFGIFQGVEHLGAGVVDEPGAMYWHEILTTDVDRAGRFYASVFEWRPETMPTASKYTVFHKGERAVAGMLPMSKDLGKATPHWLPYFQVRDVEATVKQVKSLGGQISVAPTEVPTIGRFATLRDPQGSAFGIITPS
jgi:uncharacterized protein